MLIIKKSEIPYRNFENKKKNFMLKNIKISKKKIGFKPNGKWYAIKHYWLDFISTWKKNNIKKLDNNKYKLINIYLYKLSFNKNSLTTLDKPDKNKILVLKTYKNLLKFNEKYKSKKKLKDYFHLINWYKVYEDFGGIEIQFYMDLFYFKIKLINFLNYKIKNEYYRL